MLKHHNQAQKKAAQSEPGGRGGASGGILVAGAAAGLIIYLCNCINTNTRMQIDNCTQSASLAVTLTTKDAIDGWLRCANLIGNAWLTPAGFGLDFPQQCGDVLVHMHLLYANG